MAKFTLRKVQLGEAGLVQSVSRGLHDFIYRVSTVKDPKWNIGDTVITGDGREFVYSKSASALNTGLGCSFSGTGYVAYTAAGVAAAVGATEMTVPAATHAALTEDDLAGGYVLLMNAGLVETRMIVGNAAASANAAFKIYLDAELSVAVVASTTGVEVYKNPYGALTASGDVALAKAGVPATTVAATATYFWCQKVGFIFVSPQAGITGKNRGVCWRHDGSFDTLDNGIEDSAFVSSQVAGYAAIGSADGNGPLVMLQG